MNIGLPSYSSFLLVLLIMVSPCQGQNLLERLLGIPPTRAQQPNPNGGIFLNPVLNPLASLGALQRNLQQSIHNGLAFIFGGQNNAQQVGRVAPPSPPQRQPPQPPQRGPPPFQGPQPTPTGPLQFVSVTLEPDSRVVPPDLPVATALPPKTVVETLFRSNMPTNFQGNQLEENIARNFFESEQSSTVNPFENFN